MRTQPAKQQSRKRDPDERGNVEAAQTCARPNNGVVHDGAATPIDAVAAVWVNLSALHPWPNNPTKDDPASVRRVAESIKRFGFGAPLVARAENGEIIAGHTRFKAAQLLKLPSVPVRLLDITEQDAHALALADNRLAALTQRSNEALAAALRDMPSIDQVIAGYEQPDIDKLLRELQGKPEIIEDDIPALPKVPVTKLGDVWALGRHRLVCGDSGDAATHDAVLRGDAVAAVVTDPPYGIGVDYAGFEDTAANVERLIERMMPLVLRHPCVALTPGFPAVWIYPRPTWIGAWIHPAPNGSCPWGFCGTNLILFYGGDPYLKNGHGRRPDSVAMASDRQGIDGHPTPKPMKVWAWLVERVTPDGNATVLDPFLGSGTTLIAAEQLGRRCFGIELSPAYCDVIVERWQNLTGQKGKRE